MQGVRYTFILSKALLMFITFTEHYDVILKKDTKYINKGKHVKTPPYFICQIKLCGNPIYVFFYKQVVKIVILYLKHLDLLFS